MSSYRPSAYTSKYYAPKRGISRKTLQTRESDGQMTDSPVSQPVHVHAYATHDISVCAGNSEELYERFEALIRRECPPMMSAAINYVWDHRQQLDSAPGYEVFRFTLEPPPGR